MKPLSVPLLSDAELTATERQLVDSERLGASILSSLHEQRQSLQHALGRQELLTEDIGATSRSVEVLQHKRFVRRMIWGLAVLLMAAVTGVAIYLKYFQPPPPPPPAPPPLSPAASAKVHDVLPVRWPR